MFDAVGGADAIKRVGTRRLALTGGAEAVGKFLRTCLRSLSQSDFDPKEKR